MSTELPGERLQRRLGLLERPAEDAHSDPDADVVEDDPNRLLPQWQPAAAGDAGWLGRLRADPGRTGGIALAAVAAVAVLVTVFTVVRDQPAPVMSAKLPAVEMVATASPSAPAEQPDPQQVVVSVVGLVHRPGLTTLAPGARVADALGAAGGALDGADTIGLNLARPLVDGEQIVVGIAPRAGQPVVLGSSVGPGGPAPDAPSTSAAAGPPGSGAKPGGPVNLNTATVAQLDALPGVGPVTAAAIVAWRDAHGRFASVDQLGDVDGIGPGRLEKLRSRVCV